MTRKRFIKLLMSRGYDRNFANNYVRLVKVLTKSYQKEWDLLNHKTYGDKIYKRI